MPSVGDEDVEGNDVKTSRPSALNSVLTLLMTPPPLSGSVLTSVGLVIESYDVVVLSVPLEGNRIECASEARISDCRARVGGWLVDQC